MQEWRIKRRIVSKHMTIEEEGTVNRAAESGFEPRRKIFFGLPSRSSPAEKLYTK
jgi:hypothetical protein